MRYTYRDDSFNLLTSIVMILLGLVMLLWPRRVMSTFMTILGFALLAGGAMSIWSWSRSRALDMSVMTLAQGIALAAAGLLMLLAPRKFISLIPIVVGIAVLLNGILNLAQAVDLRRMGYPNWHVSLVLALLTLLFGMVIIARPFKTMEMLVAGIGVALLYNGISNLWIESRYRSMYK